MHALTDIRIRCYRHGLGDCFLLTLSYNGNNKFHILIDCGVILGTTNPDQLMQRVVADIEKEVGNSIQTVVVTHEHWDHLSGFLQAKDIFDRIAFNEVWMAWTEDPQDPLAAKIRKSREEKKNALQVSFAELKKQSESDQLMTSKQKVSRLSYLNAVEEVLSFNGALGAAGSSTTDALAYVKQKAGANIYFCRPGTEPFTLKDIDGIRFYVLGPPQDEALLKKDMSKRETYHSLFLTEFGNAFVEAMNVKGNASDKFRPFDKVTGKSLQQAKQDTVFSTYFNTDAYRQIETDWKDFTGQLALAMDNDTNNTSLVLAIELTASGKFLLFPGDAQVGNWLSWYNYSWQVTNNKGEKETLDIKTILSRTIFYKVSHHGSHNATLSTKGLEMMTHPELVAVIPVNRVMAQKKRWNMPFPLLLNSLKEKTAGKLLIGDEDLVENAPRPSKASAVEWSKFMTSVKPDPGKLYFDINIKC